MTGLVVGLWALVAAQVVGGDPYERTLTDNQDRLAACLYWDTDVLRFQQVTGGGATEAMHEAVSASWQTWNAVLSRCGNMALEEGARLQDRTVGYEPSGENRNVVLFRSRSCDDPGVRTGSCDTGECGNLFDCWEWPAGTIALTTSTYNRNTGRVFDSDVEMNGADYAFTTVEGPPCSGPGCTCQGGSPCVLTDVRNTMTHEVGHVLGLDHTTYPGSTMNASADLGETSKRAVDLGSQDFICAVYPKGQPTQSCLVRTMPQALGARARGCAAGGAGPAVLGVLALSGLLRRRRAREAGGGGPVERKVGRAGADLVRGAGCVTRGA